MSVPGNAWPAGITTAVDDASMSQNFLTESSDLRLSLSTPGTKGG